MIQKRKRTAIRSVKWTTREWGDLSLSVGVAFGAAMVGAVINFSQRIDAFFRPHANQPIVQFVIQFLVLWLIALLVMTYLRWRKATVKNAELEDIIDSISPDVFLVVDPQRNILMTSVSVRRMFGHDPEEVLHKKTDLLYADRRCMPNVKNEVRDALERDGFSVPGVITHRFRAKYRFKRSLPFSFSALHLRLPRLRSNGTGSKLISCVSRGEYYE